MSSRKPLTILNKALPLRERGASLSGYGLIVGLVAVVALGAITGVGDSVKTLFGDTSDSMVQVVSSDTVPDLFGNDAPVFTNGATATLDILEDAGSVDIGYLLAAIDPDPGTNALQWTLTGAPSLGNLAGLPASANAPAGQTTSPGGVSFTPNAGISGADSASIQVSDGQGSNSITLDIIIESVNDAPSISLAGNQTATPGDGTVTVSSFASGFGAGAADESGQIIADFIVAEVSDASNVVSNVDIDNTGTLSFDVHASNTGVATISVQVQDDGGTANGGVDLSASQSFDITVQGGLYSFTSHTFTSCGATGRLGPSESACESAYSSQPWATDNGIFSVVSNGVQQWTVPETGTYEFVIAAPSLHPSYSGGQGSIITAVEDLNEGEIVNIVVGQRGVGSWPVTEGSTVNSNDGLGGPGGSFVYTGAISGTGLIGAAGGGNVNCTPSNLTSCPGHSNIGYAYELHTSSVHSGPGAGWFSTVGKDPERVVQGGQHWVGGNESDCGYTSCALQPGGFGGGGGSGNDNIGGAGGYTGGTNVANNSYSNDGHAGGSSPLSATRSTSVVFTGSNAGTGYVTVTRQ